MKKILTLLFTLLLLTSCSETTENVYKFMGESKHWKAEYYYKVTEKWGETDGTKTYSIKDNYKFKLNYKGTLEELSALERIEYSYETFSSSGKTTEEFTEPLTTVTFSSSGATEGGAKVGEDEVIMVNVKWDGLEESFKMQNNGK